MWCNSQAALTDSLNIPVNSLWELSGYPLPISQGHLFLQYFWDIPRGDCRDLLLECSRNNTSGKWLGSPLGILHEYLKKNWLGSPLGIFHEYLKKNRLGSPLVIFHEYLKKNRLGSPLVIFHEYLEKNRLGSPLVIFHEYLKKNWLGSPLWMFHE